MLKKLLPILIISSLISPPVVQVAQAGVLDSTVSFTSCTASGFISGKIAEGLNDLEGWVKDTLQNWGKEKLANNGARVFAGVNAGIGSSVPVTDSGVEGAVIKFKRTYTTKEVAQDIIARCTAREILTAMGRNINNAARTGGRNGGPVWVRNWRNFSLDAQYRGEGIFRGMLYSTKLCNYFGSDLKNLFGANENIDLTKIQTRTNDFDLFQVKTGCTLPGNFDMNKYKKDFSGNGGWEAWSRLLEPQNNYYGALFRSLDEAQKQRSIEEAADINEAGPTGFTSVRGKNAADSCAVKSRDGRCLIYKDILTPGGILSGAVVSGIESELQWVASSDELNEVTASAINVLVSRLMDLSNPDEGDYIVPGNIDVSIPPFPPPDDGNGGGGFCSDQGGGEDYAGNLGDAMDAVIADNPGGIADALNGWENSLIFLNYVAEQLQSSGLRATTDVLNGNDNPNRGDLIAVWSSGDSTAERYDAVGNAGAEDTPLREAKRIDYTGDIPLSCAGGAGGGGGGGGNGGGRDGNDQAF